MLLAVPLAPLAGSVLAGIFGTAFGGNKFGRGVSHSLTILGVLLSFVLSALVFQSVVYDGARFDATIYEWMGYLFYGQYITSVLRLILSFTILTVIDMDYYISNQLFLS